MSDIPAIINHFNLKPDENDFRDKILLIKLLALLRDCVPQEIDNMIDLPNAWQEDDRDGIKKLQTKFNF